MTTRWIACGVGRWWAAAVTVLVVIWLAGRRTRMTPGAWLDATDVLAGGLAIVLGAWGARMMWRERGAGPVAAWPVSPAAWFGGQTLAVALALAVACAGLAAIGAVTHPDAFRSVVDEPGVRVDGAARTLYGERWAFGDGGALRWRVRGLPVEATFSTRLRVVFRRMPEHALVPVSVAGAGDPVQRLIPPGGAIEFTLAPHGEPYDVVLTVGRGDVWVRPERDATRVVSSTAQSRWSVWAKAGLVAWLRAAWLATVAQALALFVSPPIALLGALAMWLVGSVAPFLEEYARYLGRTSIFSARAGQSAPPTAASTWISTVVAWIPNLRGGRVVDTMSNGWGPSLMAAFRDGLGAILAASVVAAAAAGSATRVWRREPGRIPGERSGR